MKTFKLGKISWSMILALSVSLTATAQAPTRPRPLEPAGRLLDAPALQARLGGHSVSSSAGTVYVETSGTDSTRCGSQHLPCRTINYGLGRARQIQPDPPMPVFVPNSPVPSGLVTVQVGPGTFEERVVITFGWVRIQGAGAGKTVITGGHESDLSAFAVMVFGQGVYLDGLTFSDSDAGMWSLSGGGVHVTNSSFSGNNDGFVVASSYGFAQYCTFTDNLYGAWAISSSRMHLWDITMTGPGTEVEGEGVLCGYNSSVILQSTDPETPVTITNYMYGIEAFSMGLLSANYVRVTDNTVGVFVHGKSGVGLNHSTLDNNLWTGSWVSGDSYLTVANTEVSGNGLGDNGIGGIYLSDFAHASLRNVTFRDNAGGVDVYAEPNTFSEYLIRP